MTAAAIQSTTTNTTAANDSRRQLKLYMVMSPWHPRDPELGTFEEKVWATDEDDAQRELAMRMAECEDSGCHTEEEESEWVEEHLEACEFQMVVSDVAISIGDDVRELIAGPEGDMDAAAKADYEAIMATLAKYSMPR